MHQMVVMGKVIEMGHRIAARVRRVGRGRRMVVVPLVGCRVLVMVQ